jgi:ferritin-like metal-binding protein YciE
MSLREVLIDELRDLYSAENQLIKAMPKVAKAAESPELKQIFTHHLEETKGHVERLKQAFELLGKKPTGKHCSGMEGAIDEVKEALEEDEEGALFDAGLVAAAARVEHYEIAGYSVAVLIASTLAEPEIAALLKQTLAEEQNAAKLVMTTAKTLLKQALAEEGDDKKVPEKKPKDAKEKKSDAESKKDESDAAKILKNSAPEMVQAAPAKKSSSKKKS